MRRPPRPRAKQLAIARAAGVSVSTVSRALSNAPGISEERRSQIRKLAHESGYVGRSVATEVTRTLLVYVTSSIATGGLAPFYDAVVKELVENARQAGLLLVVRLVDEATFDLARMLRDFATANPAGMLLVGIDPSEEIASHWRAEPPPLLLVNGYDPDMRFDCVAPNNFFGGMLATRRLLAAGHRSLLYVEDHIRWTTIQRRRGFLAALEDCAGARGEVLAITDNRAASLAAAVARRRAGKSDWTGVFCVNDMTAIRLIGALEAGGLRVPDDVSIVGFDDLPYAAMLNPPLSTMTVDSTALARQAIALLLRRLGDPDATPVQVECGVGPRAGGTIIELAHQAEGG